jgi:hypothetical protein
VTGGIADRISFRLDDASAEPAIIGIMARYLANQVARRLDSLSWEFHRTQMPKATEGGVSCAHFISHRLPRSAGGVRKRLEFAEHCRDEFRNSRVNVHGPLNDSIRRSGIHHIKDRVNGLVTAGSKDGGSQDLVGLGIHHDLHKPLRLALLNGATNLRHRPPPNQRAATAFANFFLSQACTAERRINVQSIGGNAVADFARVIIQKIRADDFSIVEGRVCECLPIAIP